MSEVTISTPQDINAGAKADAAALAAFNGTTAPAASPAVPAGNPASGLLAGKYSTQEELVKGIENIRGKLGYQAALDTSGLSPDYLSGMYKTLESEMGRRAAVPPVPADPNNKLAISTPKAPQSVDISAIQSEWRAGNGSLTEATMKSFEEKGISRDMLQMALHGIDALEERSFSESVKIVGTEQDYANMSTWASANLSEDQLVAFNESVGPRATPGQRALAIRGINSLWRSQNPSHPAEPVMGSGGPVVNGLAFRSMDEWKRAMMDPKYKTDSAYRKDVDVRLEAAHKQGII